MRALNAPIYPNAPDLPGPGLPRLSCDGIDGRAATAIFVSADADRTATTARIDAPLATIAAAQALASDPERDRGDPRGRRRLPAGWRLDPIDDVTIAGGYDSGDGWSRALGNISTLTGAPQAVLADGDTGVTLQLLSFSAHGRQ